MRQSNLRRLVGGVHACKLILVALFVAVLGHPNGAAAQTTFYDAPRSLLPGRPGSLVRSERIAGAPLGAAAYRVLYRSRGLKDEPIFVSGAVVVPGGEPPAEGRPIVSWAHPTTGITPRCAPSLAIFLFQQIQGLRSFVERGYVVAATDYPGLGTPGPHPYLVGDSEARAVIDAVRVAGGMPGAGGGKRFVVWGHHSEGQPVTVMRRLAFDQEFSRRFVSDLPPRLDTNSDVLKPVTGRRGCAENF
jgi:hypothetical protein